MRDDSTSSTVSGSRIMARGLSCAHLRVATASSASCSLVVPYSCMWRVGGQRVAGGRSGEPEGLLELQPERVGAEARARHADARRSALAVRDERHVDQPGVDRGGGVLHVGDERAAADLRAVDPARTDAHVLGGLRAHPEPGAEHGVDVAHAEPGVGQRVAGGLGVQHERRLVRQFAVLVRLGRAGDRDAAPQAPSITAHAAPPAGRNRGSAISGVASSNTTSTGMPMRIVAGSGATSTRLVIMRGPSSSSTIAST